MLGFRRVTHARIAATHRSVFERYGETIIQLMVASSFTPRAPELQKMYTDNAMIENAVQWLIERADIRANHEWRIELVEWSILIFVIIGVVVESGLGRLLLHRLGWIS